MGQARVCQKRRAFAGMTSKAMNEPLFDAKQVRRAFSRSAASYDAVAQLQRLAEARLIESLDYLDDPALARKLFKTAVELYEETGAVVSMRESITCSGSACSYTRRYL